MGYSESSEESEGYLLRQKEAQTQEIVVGLVSTYHKNVQAGIVRFGKSYRRFAKIHSGNVPIHIFHPYQRSVVLYYPDAQFVTKHGRRYVFEILDSELKDQNLIIADVIQACLAPNTSKVFFIVPREEDQDKVKGIAVTIVARLQELGVAMKEIPRTVAVFYILRSEARTSESAMNVLKASAKDRGVTI